MPFALSQLPDEPIIVGSLEFPIHDYLDELPILRARLDEIASAQPGLTVVIWDIRAQDISYSDIILLLDEAREGGPGNLTDPRLRPIVISTHPIARVGANKARQMFYIDIPLFSTLEMALAQARAEIRAQHE